MPGQISQFYCPEGTWFESLNPEPFDGVQLHNHARYQQQNVPGVIDLPSADPPLT